MAMDKFKNRTILLSIISILIFALGTNAKESSLKDLPQPDMSFELFQKFYKTKEYVFVITDVEDKVKYKNIWTKCKIIKPDVSAIVKYENQLDEQDYSKHIFVCGPIDSFEKWKSFGLPIEKIEGGFRFVTYNFTDKDDGICFLSSDASRVVYTGNSLSPIDKLLRTMCGLFQYTIVQHGVPAHFGNFVNGQFDSRGHIDLRKERKRYLNRKMTSKHYVFHYSDKVSSSDKLEVKAAGFAPDTNRLSTHKYFHGIFRKSKSVARKKPARQSCPTNEQLRRNRQPFHFDKKTISINQAT